MWQVDKRLSEHRLLYHCYCGFELAQKFCLWEASAVVVVAAAEMIDVAEKIVVLKVEKK